MDDASRALQLWPLLVLAARTNTILSYTMIQDMTGLVRQNPDALGHIAVYCMDNHLPLLSSLAVSHLAGNPEGDFYKGMDIAAEQRRCFVYDWLAEDKTENKRKRPTLEQLEDVWTRREEIKRRLLAQRAQAAGGAAAGAGSNLSI